ncbi:hypothetical protein [Mycobacteroides chelonae]|jgi:hypothetical protein|uniref:hypothetical protein n=1 Tax=Mycobacteroides chelonae TaxID=1774 RepID=UPI000992A4E3|nr:hypothetical protein [Mycobacteroides chelonae]
MKAILGLIAAVMITMGMLFIASLVAVASVIAENLVPLLLVALGALLWSAWRSTQRRKPADCLGGAEELHTLVDPATGAPIVVRRLVTEAGETVFVPVPIGVRADQRRRELSWRDWAGQ